jgi:hypothetical protein
MELKHELALPKITVNFEEVKESLTKEMKIYDKIVVDEESYPLCKAKQGELGSLRKQIDTFRISVKKEILKPYETIEAKCAELIGIIKQVEDPIREGVSFYDDQRRMAKINTAKEIMHTVAEKSGLRPEYESQIKMMTEYANLTATEKQVTDSVDAQVATLKIMQDEEDEKRRVIIDTALASDVKPDRFLELFSKGVGLADIIKLITKPVEKVESVAPVREETTQIPIEQTAKETIATQDCETMYHIEMSFTATDAQVRAIAKYIRDMSVVYKVIENYAL